MRQGQWPGVSEHPPSRVDELRDGDRYELSEGEAVYCPPNNLRHGQLCALGALMIGTDPSVDTMGTNVGHALGDRTLRAPDLSVGDFGETESTWATKPPPLAIEYVTQGEDEADLQLKIRQFLAAGSRFIWVVRLSGPQRVEVYEQGQPVRTKLPGERLEAPGVLASRPLVEALYEREAAFEQTLQNLLERKGYAGLDAVLAEGEARGRREGLREGEAKGLREGKAAAILTVLAARGLAVDDEARGRIEACTDLARLDRWLARALTVTSAGELVDELPP